MSNSKTCASCKYFLLNDDNAEQPQGGQCRYGPPVPMLVPQRGVLGDGMGVAGVFPPVSLDTGCWKHSPATPSLSSAN